LAGEQGSELSGADVLSADELADCEIGDRCRSYVKRLMVFAVI
jgi:hypothetical protein